MICVSSDKHQAGTIRSPAGLRDGKCGIGELDGASSKPRLCDQFGRRELLVFKITNVEKPQLGLAVVGVLLSKVLSEKELVADLVEIHRHRSSLKSVRCGIRSGCRCLRL